MSAIGTHAGIDRENRLDKAYRVRAVQQKSQGKLAPHIYIYINSRILSSLNHIGPSKLRHLDPLHLVLSSQESHLGSENLIQVRQIVSGTSTSFYILSRINDTHRNR